MALARERRDVRLLKATWPAGSQPRDNLRAGAAHSAATGSLRQEGDLSNAPPGPRGGVTMPSIFLNSINMAAVTSSLIPAAGSMRPNTHMGDPACSCPPFISSTGKTG
ncbi:hypothetical protein EYF80_051357 [Liparis tanakae]|uniref:Uncharacterized protein n=1 Tax=Liparis tanakae TaxID=230148 RepID=A0A4Z2FBC6_9TELE|nr:hypothetical protein EYF80_051357 [Liparis tanakae]